MDDTPSTTLTAAEALNAGDVVTCGGILRTVAKVTVDDQAVVIEWTPPQDPDTWEYLTDGDGQRMEQPHTDTTVGSQFEVVG